MTMVEGNRPGMDEAQGASAPGCAYYDAATPEVSIIILNYNKPDLTKTCLQNLWLHTTGHRYEIIVVDNGSAPENYNPLRQLDGPARMLRLDVNRFFGDGNNIGAEAARGEYVLFLNNDAFVTAGWLEPLMAGLKGDPRLGAVGPRFLYPDGRLQEAGGFVGPDGVVVQVGKFGAYAAADVSEDHFVDYCSAACLLLRRDLFLDIGGFEYVYEPAYYEDLDLCLKIATRGLMVGYCSRSHVVHVENATSSTHRKALGLTNIIEVNRGQFLSRWGAYLAARDAEALREPPGLPSPPANLLGRPRAAFYTPFAVTPGGGERYLLTAALALAPEFDVHLVLEEIYSHTRMAAVGRDLDLDLSALKMTRRSDVGGCGPIAFSVTMSNEMLPPYPAFAPHSLYICQFPFPLAEAERLRRTGNLNGFAKTIVYSDFVKGHLRRALAQRGLSDHPIEVVAPPVPLAPAGILPTALAEPYRFVLIGRFFTGGHNKRHDVAIELIRRLAARGLPVTLDLIGGIQPGGEHRNHFQWLQGLAQGLPVTFHGNASHSELHDLLSRGHVYIHAAGHEVDEETHPQDCEHFGISVLEAMSYGLAPFVVANGGPSSFVRDGVNGYLYRGLDDLEARVVAALAAPGQLTMVRRAAAVAARAFAEDVFAERWRRLASVALEAGPTR